MKLDDKLVEILLKHEDKIPFVIGAIAIFLLWWNPTQVDFYKDIRLWKEILGGQL